MGLHKIGSHGLSRWLPYFPMVTCSGRSWSPVVSYDLSKEATWTIMVFVGSPWSISVSILDPFVFHRFLHRKDDETSRTMWYTIVPEKKEILIPWNSATFCGFSHRNESSSYRLSYDPILIKHANVFDSVVNNELPWNPLIEWWIDWKLARRIQVISESWTKDSRGSKLREGIRNTRQSTLT